MCTLFEEFSLSVFARPIKNKYLSSIRQTIKKNNQKQWLKLKRTTIEEINGMHAKRERPIDVYTGHGVTIPVCPDALQSTNDNPHILEGGNAVDIVHCLKSSLPGK